MIAAAICAFVLLGLDEVFGRDFSSARTYIILMSMAYALGAGAAVSSNSLQVLGRSGLVTKIQIVTLTLRGLLAIALIPIYGAFGASLSLIIGTFAQRLVMKKGLSGELRRREECA